MDPVGQACPYPFGEPDRLTLHPAYAELRSRPGLTRVRLPYGQPAWLATRYQDVRFVLTDPRFSRELAIENDEPRTYPEHRDLGMLDMDAPRHTRIRRVVGAAFSSARVAKIRPRTQDIADALVDDLLGGPRPADLVESFTRALPVTVICEMFGLPETDRARFGRWAEAMTSTDRLTFEQVGEYVNLLWAYLAELVVQRRTEPTDDILTALVVACDTDRLSEHEIAQIAAGQVAASYETTASQLTTFVYALLTNPAQLDLLRADPALIRPGVEELLRYTPMQAAACFARYATEDIVVGGTLVEAGTQVLVSTTSANKDTSVFTDPDRLELTREVKAHLSFGAGIHRCLGHEVARMMLQVGIGTLVHRLPGLRLAVPEEDLVWAQKQLMRGIKELPVTW